MFYRGEDWVVGDGAVVVANILFHEEVGGGEDGVEGDVEAALVGLAWLLWGCHNAEFTFFAVEF